MVTKSRLLQSALTFAAVALVATGLSAQRPANAGKPSNEPQKNTRAAAGKKKGITATQKANVRERVAVAMRILDRHEAEARAQGLSEGWRQAQLEALLPLSLDSLRSVESAPDLESLAAAVALAVDEPLSLGSPTDDLVYKPVAPCRYIDTRNAGGKISGYRGYDLALAGSSYGGAAACAPQTIFGVDDDAIGALVMNVLVLEPSSAPGWLAVRPVQSDDPSTLVGWATTNVRVANQGIVTPDHQPGVAQEFWIQTSLPAHVIVDISGAFVAPEATAVETTFAQTPVVCPAGQFCSTGATCPAGWSLTGGGLGLGAFVAGFDIVWNGPGRTDAAGFNPQLWICQASNGSPSPQNMYCTAVCTRTPGR